MAKKKKRRIFQTKDNIINPEFFTIEDGKLMPTAKYLLLKGKCCNEKCKYCPYEDNNSKT